MVVNGNSDGTCTIVLLQYSSFQKKNSYELKNETITEDMIVESPVGFFLTWNMITKVFQIIFQKIPSN